MITLTAEQHSGIKLADSCLRELSDTLNEGNETRTPLSSKKYRQMFRGMFDGEELLDPKSSYRPQDSNPSYL